MITCIAFFFIINLLCQKPILFPIKITSFIFLCILFYVYTTYILLGCVQFSYIYFLIILIIFVAELQWLLLHTRSNFDSWQSWGHNFSNGHQWALQKSVWSAAAISYHASHNDILCCWNPDASTYGDTEVRFLS